MDNLSNIDPRDTQALEDAAKELHRSSIIKRENEMAMYKLLLSAEGEKLVQHWIDTYVYTFIAMPHDTPTAIGIKQGQANFVMMVKQTIEQLKKGVEDGR